MTDTLDLPDDVEQALKQDWADYEDDYRDMVNYEGSEIVYEDDEIAIVDDHSKGILNQMLKDTDAPYQWVKGRMADVAHDKTEHERWRDSDSIVFPVDE